MTTTNKSTLLFAQAAAYLDKKDGPKADAAIQGALQLARSENNMRTNAFGTAAQLYMNYGFFSNALAVIEQQLQLSPDDPAALVNKGYASLQINAFDQAIPPLSRALTVLTNDASTLINRDIVHLRTSALLNRAIVYLRTGQLDLAQQDYEALQKMSPTAYPIYYGLAEIAFQRNDTNSAIRNYELYLTNNPLNPEEIKLVTNRLAALKLAGR